MKPFESDNVKKLLGILHKNPAQRIVHFTLSSHILTKHLHQFCQTYDNDYYLYCTKDVFYDKSMTKYADQSNIHIIKFDLHRPNYKIHTIEFDYLVVTLDFSKEDRGEFLKKCYPLLGTGGNIILILPKSEYSQHDEWKDLLHDQHYVSVSIIDDLFEHYDVIIAKHMHS